jgi:glycerophosphoryl diester phosphodiesterase
VSDWFGSQRPLIIAHRGASTSAPENTIAAFELALEQGADGLELDVRLSADNEVYVIHDDSVERTTNGRGRISQLTSDSINDLLIDGHLRVPTLDSIFNEIGPATLYNIELKSSHWRQRPLVEEVLAGVWRHDFEEKVLLSSFNPLVVHDIRKISNRVIPVALIHSRSFLKHLITPTGASVDHPEKYLVTKSYISWIKQRGIPVNIWTVDDLMEAEGFLRLGVNGIITNVPGSMANEFADW